MLLAARRAPTALPDGGLATAGRVRSFQTGDGGFRGAGLAGDLYYTAFALMSLRAVSGTIPPGVDAYLAANGPARQADLVHLGCWARAAWALAGGAEPLHAPELVDALAPHATDDGGYAEAPVFPTGSAYGAFFAVSLAEDAGLPVPDPDALADFVLSLRQGDGGFANRAGLPPATPATAAAMVCLRHLDRPVPDGSAEWLLERVVDGGGFAAVAGAPVADMLSTAVALHALAGAGADPGPARESCRQFLLRMYDGAGGFCPSRVDRRTDCEYTFYGLLALGHLVEE